jgi:hypothetical protein
MKLWKMRALAGLLLLAVGCTSGGPNPSPSGTSSAGPGASASALPMVAVPHDLLAQCLRLAQLNAACPRDLPAVDGSHFSGELIAQGTGHQTFSIAVGTATSYPEGNSPQTFLHVVVQGGDLADALGGFIYRPGGQPTTPRNGLMRTAERMRLARLGSHGKEPEGLYLGKVTWNGRRGTLVLAPPFEYSDSIHGDHLIFLWTQGGRGYILSIHAWEPFLETVTALHAMVDSLPPTTA